MRLWLLRVNALHTLVPFLICRSFSQVLHRAGSILRAFGAHGVPLRSRSMKHMFMPVYIIPNTHEPYRTPAAALPLKDFCFVWTLSVDQQIICMIPDEKGWVGVSRPASSVLPLSTVRPAMSS